MEIDSSNFEESWETIKCLIDDCDFISIDTELTGLLDTSVNYYDTAEMRYKAVKDNAMKYTVTQFGMCLFKYSSGNQSFQHYPLNFYVKPFSFEPEKGNFCVNPNTIKFLNKCNFDYNRSWKNGIEFIRYSELNAQLAQCDEKLSHSLSHVTSDVDIANFNGLSKLIVKCQDFLQDDLMVELQMDNPTDAFDRYLILEKLWLKVGCINGNWIFPVLEKAEPGKKKTIKITKSRDAEKAYINQIEQKHIQKQNHVTSHVKFSSVIKHMCDSKKILIAHNSFLDIMHMIDKFIEPLPETLCEFKRKLSGHFPKIFDTKYIFSNDKFKEFRASNLENLYKLTKEDPFINPDKMTAPASEEYDFGQLESFHTAHFDALLTGKVFISLATYLNGNNQDLWNSFKSSETDILKRFVNRVNLVRAEISSLNLNVDSNDRIANRKNCCFMSIPTFWNQDDVRRHLQAIIDKPFKQIYELIDLTWINSTSLVVKFQPPLNVDMESVASLNDDPSVQLVPFMRHYRLNDANCDAVDDDGFVRVKRFKAG